MITKGFGDDCSENSPVTLVSNFYDWIMNITGNAMYCQNPLEDPSWGTGGGNETEDIHITSFEPDYKKGKPDKDRYDVMLVNYKAAASSLYHINYEKIILSLYLILLKTMSRYY